MKEEVKAKLALAAVAQLHLVRCSLRSLISPRTVNPRRTASKISSHRLHFRLLTSWLFSARTLKLPIGCCSSRTTSVTLRRRSLRRPTVATESAGLTMTESIYSISLSFRRPPQTTYCFHSAGGDCDAKPSNQSMKPMAPLRCESNAFATTPRRGISLSR
jgi:hypothetical protein